DRAASSKRLPVEGLHWNHWFNGHPKPGSRFAYLLSGVCL
ncbi:MAG: hypothetical protein AVDCRST_MAG91-2814, partial [uncultured Sphingomonadaceae bacterium]